MSDEQPNRWWAVIASGLSVFMVQLDVTIVTVALPSIEADLGTDVFATQWVVLGYLVPLIALGLCAGRWIDVADPRRALRFASTGFAASSVAAGLSPGIGWLVSARVVQGGFAVVLLGLAPALAGLAVAPRVRGRAIGLVMLFGPIGGMVGPVVGGQIVESIGWPWIFHVNVPIAAAVVAAGARQLPLGPRLPRPPLAWLAEAATLGGAAVALLLGLSLGVDVAPAWLLLVVGAVPLVVAWGRLPASAAVRRVMAAPAVAGPHLALLTTYAALFTLMFLVPFFLQRGLDISPGRAGVVMLWFPGAVAAFGLPAGVLADRVGARWVAVAGGALITGGLASLTLVDASASGTGVGLRLAVVGAGFGLFNGQTQVMVMDGAPAHLGLVSGTTTLTRQLGIALGSAAGAGVWASAADLRPGAALGCGLAAAGVVVLARRPRALRPAFEDRSPSSVRAARAPAEP
jgi:MFS family permease